MDVIKDIEENVEKGGEAIEEIAEKGGKALKKAVKKGGVIEKAAEKIVEEVKEEIEKDTEEIEEEEEEIQGEDIEKFLKKGEKAAEKVAKKVAEVIKGEKPKPKKPETKPTKSESKKPAKISEKLPKNLEKKAELESTTEEKTLEEKKKAILEKAKKLREKLEKPKTEELVEKIRIKKKEMLIPLEEYIKTGIYLGTRVVTPGMRAFVYRRRADGLAIFNTDLIDEKLREGIKYLSEFAPEDVILVCKREAGWKAAKKFGGITGIRVFTKKYPAGILTNKQLPDFFENELTIITDQWIDRNAMNDTLKVHKKVLMICDTNNFPKGANQIILGNNKSSKSLGLIFYLLARGYCEARGIRADIPELEWWTAEEEPEEKIAEAARPSGAESEKEEIITEPGAGFEG